LLGPVLKTGATELVVQVGTAAITDVESSRGTAGTVSASVGSAHRLGDLVAVRLGGLF
jgi:hypothetical protein